MTEVFDESSRPRVAGRVELTPAQRLPGQHLRDIHNHFRSQLAALRAGVDEVRDGEASVAEIRTSLQGIDTGLNRLMVGGLCAQVCRYVTLHHSIEDQYLFPQVGQYAEYAPVARRLAEEHVVIHEELAHIEGILDGLEADLNALDDLDGAVAHLTALLESHFSYEEVELTEPLGLMGIMG